jgi:hypothetical protein
MKFVRETGALSTTHGASECHPSPSVDDVESSGKVYTELAGLCSPSGEGRGGELRAPFNEEDAAEAARISLIASKAERKYESQQSYTSQEGSFSSY